MAGERFQRLPATALPDYLRTLLLPPLDAGFRTMPTPMTLAEIKGLLRAGQYAWPGGYPLYFITSDGAALSFGTVRAEWRNVVQAHLRNANPSACHLPASAPNCET